MKPDFMGEEVVPGKHKKKCKGFIQPPPCEGCNRELLDAVHPNTVIIIDEAQNGKNPKAEQSIRMKALSVAVRRKGGRIWLLSGTPLENTPIELWNVLDLAGIAEEAFDDLPTFRRLFDAKVKVGGYGFDWGMPTNEVVERFQRVSIRRMKKDVLTELPAKLYQTSFVEIDKKTLKMCDRLSEALGVDGLRETIENEEGMGLGEFSRVRAALATAKIPSLLDLVEDFEARKEPLVVFSAHRRPIDIVGARPGWVTVTGSEDAEEKKKAAAAFQKGEDENGNPVVGIALTIGAGGVSLTLTRAKYCVFVDRHPNPAKNAQAEDRIHRLT